MFVALTKLRNIFDMVEEIEHLENRKVFFLRFNKSAINFALN